VESCTTLSEGCARFEGKPKNVKPTHDDKMQFQFGPWGSDFDNEKKMVAMAQFDAII
jgi:hypothetical protein